MKGGRYYGTTVPLDRDIWRWSASAEVLVVRSLSFWVLPFLSVFAVSAYLGFEFCTSVVGGGGCSSLELVTKRHCIIFVISVYRIWYNVVLYCIEEVSKIGSR